MDKGCSESPYFIGEDLDLTCCKMTAINMCAHGIPGEVICHNTLSEPDTVKNGFIINEHLMFMPIPSIRITNNKNLFVLFRKRKEEKHGK